MNPNINETEAIIQTLNDIAAFLYGNAKMTDFNLFRNGTTSATYKLNEYYINVKKDANCKAYSVTIHLNKFSTLTGKKDDNIIATSTGDVPF